MEKFYELTDPRSNNDAADPSFIYSSSEGQLISKANFKAFIWTKKTTKLFCISVLASKNLLKVVETKDKITKRLI